MNARNGIDLWHEHLDHTPADAAELRAWIALHTGLVLPERPTCPGHNTPIDYLAHSFFETADNPPDAAVWACRGGGKTMMGALATLLDLVFKPGIQVRILGGSLEQSDRMYAYLRKLFSGELAPLLRGPPTRRGLELLNDSRVEILAQSDCSVRGTRVQKLRCDEVELFDPDVWSAAQLATRSMNGPPPARGAVHALSTMHKPAGLMQRLLQEQAATRKTFSWCVWDIIATCPPERSCAKCPLWDDCRGRAKQAQGFVPVQDVIAMKSRVSRAAWEHEMLCHPPRLENAVFHAFTRASHVQPWPGPRGGRLRAGSRFLDAHRGWITLEQLIAGVDFGYRGAFVALWIAMLRDPAGQRLAWVVDELVQRERTLPANIRAMRRSGIDAPAPDHAEGWRPAIVYCDVAGRGTSGQTGRTDESLLRDAGFKVRSAAMGVEAGVAAVNELVDPALAGAELPRLLIDPRCLRLIEAMEGYQRKPDGTIDKDGRHDHLIDALRYALVHHDKPRGRIIQRGY